MFEPLISSRIRRSLVDYLLVHPHDRFYLRGLAKELSLSVSPLRRELKRLHQAGLLGSFQEANILYYTVNINSPLFHQLQQAVSPQLAPGKSAGPVVSEPVAASAPVKRGLFRLALPAVFVASLLISAAVISVNRHRFLSGLNSVLSFRRQPIAAVSSSSGTMRGSRWQVVPGSMGGAFSAAGNPETYH